MKSLLVCLTLALCAVPSWADCRARVVKKVIVRQQVAVAVAPVIAVPVFIPTYSIGWAPPVYTPAAPTPVAPAVMPSATAGTAAEAAPDALSIFSVKCAACHDASEARTKGKGFTLLAGGAIAPLTDRQLLRLYGKVSARTMPPKKHPQLTDSEASALQDWIDAQAEAKPAG